MYTLNYYKCISKPTVVKNTPIEEWINLIIGSNYSKVIEMARNGDLDYDSIKASLPSVTYNFFYKDYKKDENIISSTGLLYFDIDDESFDIDLLDKSKVYIYYKSFGGKGYSAIVKVKGITKDNFKSNYLFIANELNILRYVDCNAIKHSQFNVLSYDPYIYINDTSYIFNSINEIEKKTQPLCNNQKKGEHIRSIGSITVRYNNLYDFDFAGWDCISNWKEGFDYIECFLPFKRLTDKRKRTLLSFTTNFVWLNPSLDYYHYVNLIQSVNEKICLEPLPSNLIVGMVKSVLKQKNENKLKPHVKKRRLLFAPFCELTREQKLKTVSDSIRDKFKVEGCGRINDCLENWQFNLMGKITAKSISQNAGMNLKTVKKYYSEFKSYINDLNDENIKIKMKKKVNITLLDIGSSETDIVGDFRESSPVETIEIVNTQFGEVAIRDYSNVLKLVLDAGATEADLLESIEENMNKVFLTNLKINYRYDFDSNREYAIISVA